MTPRRLERTVIRISGRIAGRDSIYFFAVWQSARTPGLAIHFGALDGKPCLDLGWTITHVRSGVAVLKWLPTLAVAVSVLDEIGALCDWTRTAREIDQLAHRDTIVRQLNRIASREYLGLQLKVGPVSEESLASSAALSGGIA